MTVLVTGAAGLLGSHVAELALEHSEAVRVLVRPGEEVSWLAKAGVEVCRAALTAGVRLVVHISTFTIYNMMIGRERAVGQVYNIGNDQPLTREQYLSAIAQDIGVAPSHIHVPYSPMYAAAYAAERLATLSSYRISPVITRHGVKILGEDSRLSIDKARHHLGYAPQVSVREGVRLTVTWYLQQNSRTPEFEKHLVR